MRPRIGGKVGALLLKPIAGHGFLNVRAYVRHHGETGIYFLAEWLSNPVSVMLGPRCFGLPYRLGHLEYEHQHETGLLRGNVSDGKNGANGTNIAPRLEYSAKINPVSAFEPCAAGSCAEFLMERYTAFTEHNSRRRFFRIWHPPWPQTPIDVDVQDTSLLTASWPWFADAVMIGANYSPGLEHVWMGRPHTIAE
jgi:hypothetical protein